MGTRPGSPAQSRRCQCAPWLPSPRRVGPRSATPSGDQPLHLICQHERARAVAALGHSGAESIPHFVRPDAAALSRWRDVR